LFIDRRAKLALGRMASLPIVKDLDVCKDRPLRLLPCLIGVPVRPLAFEGTEERLHRGIIVALAFPAHTHDDACRSQPRLLGATSRVYQ
jgi:hypothetical protein